MTDPAPLSPAAQAVLDAAQKQTDLDFGYAPQIAAAALRAAVGQCKVEWNFHPDYPETEWVVVASDLLTIATELENHQ